MTVQNISKIRVLEELHTMEREGKLRSFLIKFPKPIDGKERYVRVYVTSWTQNNPKGAITS